MNRAKVPLSCDGVVLGPYPMSPFGLLDLILGWPIILALGRMPSPGCARISVASVANPQRGKEG
jgi:hypothetical protein